jgi:lipid-A-disaccharide synthase
MNAPPTIVVSSGEMSGDLHAAHLVAALRKQINGVRVRALGGDRCAEAGAEVLFHYRDYAILGFTGVLANLPRLWRLERALRREIERADLFIAVDYPGLNLRLAAHARKCGVPVLYYISPQLWAWGAGRMDRIAENVDRMAVILPFEEALYREHRVEAEFVGHPFVVDHELEPPLPQRERSGAALLPGSRDQEVRRILPVLLGAAARLRERFPDLEFTVGRSPAVDRSIYDTMIGRSGIEMAVDDDAVAVMRRSRVMLVASGTATLQGALMETPLVIVYRVSPLNYFLASRLVRIQNIGLVNVVLGDRVAPELIQHEATPAAVAAAAGALIPDGTPRSEMLSKFRSLRALLDGGGGCERVAEMARELIER